MSELTKNDKWIPWYFVLFFVVVAAVNAVMVTFAIRTHTGTITDHPYEKGIAYNRVVEAETQQEAMKWHAQIELQHGMLHVLLKDENGAILQPDELTAHITRPTQAGMDFDVALKNGKTQVDFPAQGLWEVRIFATVGKQHCQQSQRVVAQ